MVKPVATTTNMTITLQHQGDVSPAIKPLVVSKEMVLHTNIAADPILPHQPVARELDHTPKQDRSGVFHLAHSAMTHRRRNDGIKLDEFRRVRLELLSNRY